MPVRLRLGAAFFVLTFATAVTAPAAAQTPETSARAAELKKRGDDAMDRGRPSDALVAYTEAYQLSEDPALLYNKGRALEALTDYPAALEALEAFDRAAPPELKQRVPNLARKIGELRQKTTTLSVTCNTPGARVRLGDRTIGTCPLPESLRVLAGKSAIEVTAEGYFPWTKDVDLPGGGLASIDVVLMSRETSAVLVVKTSARAAEVRIDGKVIGNAPVETSLVAGPHEVEARLSGYSPAKSSAVLVAGERRELTIDMQSEPGILGRWWFWTGAGLVVVGGVVLAVALTTDKDPVKGSISPGVVRGGLEGAGFRF